MNEPPPASSAPSAAAPGPPRPRRPDNLNIPNALTLLRLILCVGFFGILIYATTELRLPVDGEGELAWHTWKGQLRAAHAGLREDGQGLSLLFDIAFGIFLLAAATDTLDGQIARRWGLETDLGRIADPFVDKIMILGALTLLMPLTLHIAGWMVVLVLARELLVSGIRSFAESRGVAFPANFWGKAKMLSQIACVAACVLYVGHPDSRACKWVFLPLLWWTMVATVVSGAVYLGRASRLVLLGRAGEEASS
jgi:CDP-diacylglycerol--glycerol-3-phosphate 3-phosphatidyltransferase